MTLHLALSALPTLLFAAYNVLMLTVISNQAADNPLHKNDHKLMGTVSCLLFIQAVSHWVAYFLHRA